jgi:hypothetical protein
MGTPVVCACLGLDQLGAGPHRWQRVQVHLPTKDIAAADSRDMTAALVTASVASEAPLEVCSCATHLHATGRRAHAQHDTLEGPEQLLLVQPAGHLRGGARHVSSSPHLAPGLVRTAAVQTSQDMSI